MKTTTRFALLVSSVACSAALLTAAFTPAQAYPVRTGSTTVEHVAPASVPAAVIDLPPVVIVGSVAGSAKCAALTDSELSGLTDDQWEDRNIDCAPAKSAARKPVARRVTTASAFCVSRVLEQGGSPAHPSVLVCSGDMSAL